MGAYPPIIPFEKSANLLLTYRVPYSTRHTFAAWALTIGMHPERLVRLMGHSTKKMVYETYGNYVEGLESDGELKVLNINLDTSTPTGKLMLTMLGAIATFEREMLLERQAEGIAKAKARGVYKGRQPSARANKAEVVEMDAKGMTKQSIADNLGIGVASVYRILKDATT